MFEISTAFIGDPKLIAALEKQAKPVDLGSNRILFYQGSPPIGVFIVRNGQVMLTRRVGEEVGTVLVGAGSLLGLPATIGAKPYSLSAEAMADADVSVVTGGYFVHLMHTEAEFSFHVLQVLAEEVRFSREVLS